MTPCCSTASHKQRFLLCSNCAGKVAGFAFLNSGLKADCWHCLTNTALLSFQALRCTLSITTCAEYHGLISLLRITAIANPQLSPSH